MGDSLLRECGKARRWFETMAHDDGCAGVERELGDAIISGSHRQLVAAATSAINWWDEFLRQNADDPMQQGLGVMRNDLAAAIWRSS